MRGRGGDDDVRIGLALHSLRAVTPEAMREKARWVLDAWIGNWLHPDFSGWSLDPVLPQVRSPALVIHGRDDEYGSPRHPERIAEKIGAAAQLELMDRTGHVPHREKEAEVIRRVQAFAAPLP